MFSFENIYRQYLLCRRNKRNTLNALWLSRVLIYHDCTEKYQFRGDPKALKNIPPHKTLFSAPKNKGLPIGNLNSQFFANVYLNGLDQFVKHHLKCRYYLRYCDDCVLLSRDRDELLGWRDQIAPYLRENLRLELNAKRQRLQPVNNGIDFLGYIVRRDYLLVRRRVVNNLRTGLRDYERMLVKEGRWFRRYRFDEATLDRLAATLSSYLGHFRMANTYNLCRSLWDRYPFLSWYFDFDPETRRLVRKYKYPRRIWRTSQQYLYYRWRCRGDVLFFQVGRFFEFYHIGDQEVARLLDLSEMQKNRRGVRYGLPVDLMDRYLWCLLRRNISVTVILERERYWIEIKERVPVWRYEKMGE